MEIRSALKNSACYYVKMQCIFSLRELDTETDSKRTEACAVPILTLALCQACSSRGKERKGGCWERVRMCVCLCVCASEWVCERERGGKHSPGRIPGSRRRAGFSLWRRGCVPGSQLAACIYTTNGAPTVSLAPHTHPHTPLMSVSTQRSSAHANARS